MPRGETASWCIPPPPLCQDDGSEPSIYVRTSHRVFAGRGSRRERWKSNYFFFFFGPISWCLPSCVRQIRLEKIEAHSPTTQRQLGSWSLSVHLRPFWSCSVSPSRVITYPSPLSLFWGDIGLILWASFFHHIQYEICPHRKFTLHDSAAHEETDTSFKVFNQNKLWGVAALNDFCFWNIPLHLFPRLSYVLGGGGGARRIEGFDIGIKVTLIDGFGHMQWQNMLWENGAEL